MMGYGYGYGWIFMFLGGLILVVIIVVIVYFLMKAANTAGKPGFSTLHNMKADDTSRALAILAERYAKGEISDDQYRHMKAQIMQS